MVYMLHKALYGLKQAPTTWNKKIDSYLVKFSFNECRYEYGVYVQFKGGDITIICMYVDDLSVIRNNIKDRDKFK